MTSIKDLYVIIRHYDVKVTVGHITLRVQAKLNMTHSYVMTRHFKIITLSMKSIVTTI